MLDRADAVIRRTQHPDQALALPIAAAAYLGHHLRDPHPVLGGKRSQPRYLPVQVCFLVSGGDPRVQNRAHILPFC